MDPSTTNPVARGLRQLDRAFWCLHENISAFVLLSLPTLFAAITFAAVVATMIRNFTLDPLLAYFFWSLVFPTIVMIILTFFPLPCAVFAWNLANDKTVSTSECYQHCFRRAGRLTRVFIGMTFDFLWWFLLFGLPMVVLWSRRCQAPLVALFEDHRRIFYRSKQLMRADNAIHVLAGLVFLIILVLGSLIPIPRLILSGNVFEGEWVRSVVDTLWIFELISGVFLFCAMAITWNVALTLFYHDVRQFREGDSLRKKITLLREKYSLAGDGSR